MVDWEPAHPNDGAYRRWTHPDDGVDTDVVYTPGELVVEGVAAPEAVAFVRENRERFEAVPGDVLDGVTSLVEAGEGVDAWVAADPEMSAFDEPDRAGFVHARGEEPGVTATARVDGSGDVDDLLFWPASPQTLDAAASEAGLYPDEVDVRTAHHAVDRDAVPDAFDGETAGADATTYTLVARAETGDAATRPDVDRSGDLLVVGDPTAVDLDTDGPVAVRAWPPGDADPDAVDAPVVPVEAHDLAPGDVAGSLGGATEAALHGSLVETFDPEGEATEGTDLSR